MKSKVILLSVLAYSSLTTAQTVGAWGQCGGINWTGGTTCVAGYYCFDQNPYYYQCIPGTSTATTTTAFTSTTLKTTTTTTTTRTTTTTTVTSKTTTTTSSAATSTSTAFAKVNGLDFEIDGVTHYFAGSNAYWLGFLTNNSDVDKVMTDFKAAGLKVLRIWGFNDVNTTPSSGTVWYQLLQSSGATINTGADGLERLDYVVQSAEAHGVKLIINFVNNWNDYGGMNAYVQAFGGNATTWYTTPVIQQTYQAYIKAVVSRYVSSPAIFAWELANEPRCNGCPLSTLTTWIETTSKYIKSLDPAHMVCLGDEGFGLNNPNDTSYPYQFGEGDDFATNLAIPTIDFGTFHLYPDSWGEPMTWGSSWVTSHAAACVAAGKPCILEEYGGENSCSNETPWQATALASKGIAGDMFWQFGDTLSNGQTANDGNTIYPNTDQWTCMVTDHVAAINSS